VLAGVTHGFAAQRESQSQQRQRFRRARLPLTPRRPELVSILSHDRGGRFEPNTYGSALIDEGTLGGNAPDDILGDQYRRPPAITLGRPAAYDLRT
jgi:hypothetical protein